MGDIVRMPLYWEARAVLHLKNVKGDIFADNTYWNLFQWDKQG